MFSLPTVNDKVSSDLSTGCSDDLWRSLHWAIWFRLNPSCPQGFIYKLRRWVSKVAETFQLWCSLRPFGKALPFPPGGLFPSWEMLKEKHNSFLRLSESGFRSGSWGGMEFNGWVFKSWLSTFLCLSPPGETRWPLFTFIWLHTKGTDSEGRKRRCLLG